MSALLWDALLLLIGYGLGYWRLHPLRWLLAKLREDR